MQQFQIRQPGPSLDNRFIIIVRPILHIKMSIYDASAGMALC